MIGLDEFHSLEHRVDEIEKTLVEMQTLIKILKPIAILLGASLGLDLHGILV
jgi:tetrahydromethanopterin S-methyltransferase subunit G